MSVFKVVKIIRKALKTDLIKPLDREQLIIFSELDNWLPCKINLYGADRIKRTKALYKEGDLFLAYEMQNFKLLRNKCWTNSVMVISIAMITLISLFCILMLPFNKIFTIIFFALFWLAQFLCLESLTVRNVDSIYVWLLTPIIFCVSFASIISDIFALVKAVGIKNYIKLII